MLHYLIVNPVLYLAVAYVSVVIHQEFDARQEKRPREAKYWVV